MYRSGNIKVPDLRKRMSRMCLVTRYQSAQHRVTIALAPCDDEARQVQAVIMIR